MIAEEVINITPEAIANRIIALHNFYENLKPAQKVQFSTPEEFYIRFFRILSSKITSSILHTIFMFKVSGSREIANTLNSTNPSYILSKLGTLSELGFVQYVKISRENISYYQKLWKGMYPNSPKLPTLFKINDDFVDIVTLYGEDLVKNLSSFDINDKIKQRMIRFNSVAEEIAEHDKRQKEIDENTLYVCEHCKSKIFKRHIKNKDYHMFPIGAICTDCFHKYGQERYKEWMSQK